MPLLLPLRVPRHLGGAVEVLEAVDSEAVAGAAQLECVVLRVHPAVWNRWRR